MEIEIDGSAQAARAKQGVIVPPLPAELRRRHSVRMYTPAEVKKWQTTARVLAAERMKGQNPLKGQLEVIIWVYLPPPSSMSLKKRALALSGGIRPITRPDCDNYAKSCLDALNSIVWLDDAQIVGLHIYKFYAEKPRVVVKVEELSHPLAELEAFEASVKQSGLFK